LCWFKEFNIKFCVVGCVEFGVDYYVIICTHNQTHEVEWEVMVTSHYYSQRRRWLDIM
jgi:hypothetical protein